MLVYNSVKCWYLDFFFFESTLGFKRTTQICLQASEGDFLKLLFYSHGSHETLQCILVWKAIDLYRGDNPKATTQKKAPQLCAGFFWFCYFCCCCSLVYLALKPSFFIKCCTVYKEQLGILKDSILAFKKNHYHTKLSYILASPEKILGWNS